jgi:hypothetical protein
LSKERGKKIELKSLVHLSPTFMQTNPKSN